MYGYSKDNSLQDESSDQLDMKDLNKIKKLYTPMKTNSYFPDIKRKSIRDIINEGRELASKRPHVASVAEKAPVNQTLRISTNNSRNNSTKKLDKLKT